jgi:hypothetical protein
MATLKWSPSNAARLMFCKSQKQLGKVSLQDHYDAQPIRISLSPDFEMVLFCRPIQSGRTLIE